MKKNILLILTLGLISVPFLKSESYTSALKCSTVEGCKDLNNTCKCFCAFEGDYRDKVPKQDHPIFLEKANDQFGKTCYCAARDLKVLEAQANGMPNDKAKEIYKNYNSPEELVLKINNK